MFKLVLLAILFTSAISQEIVSQPIVQSFKTPTAVERNTISADQAFDLIHQYIAEAARSHLNPHAAGAIRVPHGANFYYDAPVAGAPSAVKADQ